MQNKLSRAMEGKQNVYTQQRRCVFFAALRCSWNRERKSLIHSRVSIRKCWKYISRRYSCSIDTHKFKLPIRVWISLVHKAMLFQRSKFKCVRIYILARTQSKIEIAWVLKIRRDIAKKKKSEILNSGPVRQVESNRRPLICYASHTTSATF